METNRDVSVKGYWYNLEKSPYVWVSPYGDSYRLPSQKRLEMMEKRTEDELRRLDKLLDRNDLRRMIPEQMIDLIRHYVIEAVHRQIVE